MSWEQLLALLKSETREVEAFKSRPPESCTQCGKPWKRGPNGELHCKFDGTIWDGKPAKWGE